jgi:hypothetical protein
MRKYLVALLLALLPSVVVAQYDNANFIVKTYDLAATSYTYCTQFGGEASPTCGAAVTNGWVPTSNLRPIVIQVNWITKNATSLEYQVECKVSDNSDTTPGIINTISMTATGIQTGTLWPHNYSACRIGLKLTTDTGANSVTAWISNR